MSKDRGEIRAVESGVDLNAVDCSEAKLERISLSLQNVASWLFLLARYIKKIEETPMGRAQQAIQKLQSENADLQTQLAAAQANQEDAADIAAIDSVLGPDTTIGGGGTDTTTGGAGADTGSTGSPQSTLAGSTGTDSTSGAAAGN